MGIGLLFDSRDVEDWVEARWEEMDENDRPKDIWGSRCKPLWEEALQNMRYEFDELKNMLIIGMPEGDEVLLVDRKIIQPKTTYETFGWYLDESQYRLCRPKDVFGEWDHLRVYEEDDNIWIMKLARDGMRILADYQALWVPEQDEDNDLPDDVVDDKWDFIRRASLLDIESKSDLMYGICMYTKPLTSVFSRLLSK